MLVCCLMYGTLDTLNHIFFFFFVININLILSLVLIFLLGLSVNFVACAYCPIMSPVQFRYKQLSKAIALVVLPFIRKGKHFILSLSYLG